MPLKLTIDGGRKAWRRPWRAPMTLPAGTRYSGADPVVPSCGGADGNGVCLMIRRLSTSSMSLSVPKPNVLIWPLDDA
jgi:hypothetical protein